jgi:hypothetical protein
MTDDQIDKFLDAFQSDGGDVFACEKADCTLDELRANRAFRSRYGAARLRLREIAESVIFASAANGSVSSAIAYIKMNDDRAAARLESRPIRRPRVATEEDEAEYAALVARLDSGRLLAADQAHRLARLAAVRGGRPRRGRLPEP